MLFVFIKLFLTVLLCCRSSASNISDRYYPRYHLAPNGGWMNDPNGFCIFNGEYHLFYQYNPFSSLRPGIAHWGHARSPDLFHWEHLPIAMYPDQPYDKHGAFSGSAVIENGIMHLIYTGNVNHEGQIPNQEEHQALAISRDGIHFSKYPHNPIIDGNEFQPDFRDPKVWKHEGTYYMVVGNSFNNRTLGRILLFSSEDMISWQYLSIIGQSDGSLGYMWECPDLFELDGQFVLLFSPQGVKPQGDKFRNLYQTGYFVGTFDYISHVFTPYTDFIELDHGHDFYATQTTLNKDNVRTVVGWFDTWDTFYPEQGDGWTGHMTIPRTLRLVNKRLLQQPVKEIYAARGNKLYAGRPQPGKTIKLQDNTAEIKIRAPSFRNFEVFFKGNNQTVSLFYDYKRGKVILDRGGNDGIRRTGWRPYGDLKWLIYIDASSIELFCGQGEATFSSRIFPGGPIYFKVGNNSYAHELLVHSMKRTTDLSINH